MRFIFSFIAIFIWCTSTHAAPKFNRDLYFPHWSDLDHNGLNTKQEILRKTGYTLASGLHLWICPYTGYASSNPQEFQLDHIVSLSRAWDCGAFAWSQEKRERFANDPENLLLVKAGVNMSKGNNGPEQWLPTNLTFADDLINKTNYIYKKYEMTCPDPDPGKLAGRLEGLLGVDPKQLNLDRR